MSPRAGIRGVLTDIDDTLTTHGRLTPRAYAALARLQDAGRLVVPITGRPAGWCDHIARMWPVDGVVAEEPLGRVVEVADGGVHAHQHDHHLAQPQVKTDAVGHQTGKASDAHKHPAASAWMIIIGDGFHNFTDGFAIAAAFVADTRLGVVTALAIVAHELPAELSDFLVLLNAGFSKSRALFWNLVSSFATLVGALIAYFAIQGLQQYSVVFLCLAAASMIYVAIADLMPGLHSRTSLIESVQQVALIALGVLSIAAFHYFSIH